VYIFNKNTINFELHAEGPRRSV